MKFSKLMKLTTDRMTPDNWTTVNVLDSGGRRCAVGHMAAVLGLKVNPEAPYEIYGDLRLYLGDHDSVIGIWSRNDSSNSLSVVKKRLMEFAIANDFEINFPVST